MKYAMGFDERIGLKRIILRASTKPLRMRKENKYLGCSKKERKQYICMRKSKG